MDEVDVQELTQRASRLRSEGRLEESLLAARRATAQGPQDANAWWQLALTLRRLDDDGRALPALEQVTELAPYFAAGWCELGRVYQASGDLDEAIARYEEALAADNEHAPTMRALARALADDDSPSTIQRRLGLLRSLRDAKELTDDMLFDFAYLLAEQGEPAEAARMYEECTCRQSGTAAYFNLGLVYETLGRDADALDAFDTAAYLGSENSHLPRLSDALHAKLNVLAEKIARAPAALLAQTEWYQHYINPFELLDAGMPEDLRGQPKSLQKARQAVLREIELEDGRLAWMPGLVLDKSTALSTLDQLSDDDAWCTHHLVFEDKALCGFLSRGELNLFLRRADLDQAPLMPYAQDESVLRVIGPAFAAQYNRVLTRAIEQGNVDVVTCLLKGRRWVADGHAEHCIEGAKRALERLAAPVVALDKEADDRTISLEEIQRGLAAGSLGSFLPHLPIEFHAVHHAVGNALRGLAVSHYGRESDAQKAMQILELAKVCADKLPALAHMVKADENALNELIAKERSKEASIAAGQKRLQITRAGVSDGTTLLAPTNIAGVRWGMTVINNSPRTMQHTIGFQAHRGPDIVATWTKMGNQDAHRSEWSKLIDAAFHFLLGDVLESFANQIDSGREVSVGPVEVGRHGLTMDEKGWIFTNRTTVPWSELTSQLINGSLVLGSRSRPKARAELPLATTWNAIVLHLYATKKEKSNP
ncbi:tetratricopeptide repeat protein [Massilia sp. ST3]|uniref:tetratricopeptide repeat protein n=1 Tax=Massilia sp. ST3 TaxID=2824903 RepID=UPI001B813A50|nr:tetratricopeptide repeat protein [Massilia sp. ST3]MBQ5948286.1 tetratricopeptide repeat protein [Massilia sp. ST3]